MTKKLEIDRPRLVEIIELFESGRHAQACNAASQLRALLANEPVDFPECSGTPESCPENEGYGCCKVPPIIQTLHANGDRIAMEATIAQQAQRIADLERGRGEAPFYISAEDWNVLVRDDVATARVRICKANRGPFTEPLYASPPAPVAVALPSREAMRDLIAEVIGGDTYDCTRVWSAWGVGTMSEDDFVPLVESEERLYELTDACLDKVKELNP